MKLFEHLHFTGACGRAMGGLVLELQKLGQSITATDGACYAPMDAYLKERGLQVTAGFAARNLPAHTSLVVAGAGIAADNIELKAARRRKIPVLHMAQFLSDHILTQGTRIVVAGTNGKTTTAAMLAWILECAGRAPDYLIGAPCPQFANTVRFRGSKVTVLEGDEYPASPEGRRPKFHFYKPHILLLTNIQHDHAEIYPDEASVMKEFIELVNHLPARGKIFLSPTCANSLRAVQSARAACEAVPVEGLRAVKRGMTFCVGKQRLFLPMFGRMNAQDAALAVRAAQALGVSAMQIKSALASFQPVPGRLQTLLNLDTGTLVIDDNYHPAALRANIAALRMQYPRRRLVVALQPRYTGGRRGFQADTLPGALATADVVILTRPFDLKPFPEGRFSSRAALSKVRAQGVQTHQLRLLRGLNKFLPRVFRPGDVWFVSLPAGCDFITTPLTETMRRVATS